MSNSAEVGRFVFVLENADCFLFCARWHHSCCVGFVNTVFYFSGVYSRLGRESQKVGNGKLLEINFLGIGKKTDYCVSSELDVLLTASCYQVTKMLSTTAFGTRQSCSFQKKIV